MIVMGAGEAGYYTREDGPSGDDFTGLLMIPAGVLLAGIGVVTLWRSRKGGSVVRRYARRVALALGFLVTLPFVMFPFAEAYVSPTRRAPTCRPRSSARPHENVSFTTSDGLRLQGWFVPSKNGATVISFPGRKGPQKPARLLVSEGYGVLLFDRRGEGESDGDPNALGWRGTRDLEAAIAYLRSRPDVNPDRIGGVGLSVGGEMMLQAAAQNGRLQGGRVRRRGNPLGAGVRPYGGRGEGRQPSWLFGLVTAGTAVFTSDLPPPSLTDLSAEITEPALFIHATPGQGGETLTEKYYEAAKGPKEYWPAPGGHTGAFDAAPQDYERRIVGFFDRHLLGRSS